MIETTPGKILSIMRPHPGFEESANGWRKLVGVSKPADVAWEIQVVVEALQKTIEFYDKRRLAILEELGNKEGNKYDLDDEAMAEFQKEHSRLLSFPVKLNVEKLGREHIEAADLTVAEVLTAKWMFDREEFEMEDPFADMT